MSFSLSIMHGEMGFDQLDDNLDVEVKLDDGRVFSATFFTIKNIANLLRNYKDTGECSNGLYLWAADMIIVEKLSDEVITKSIEDLIETGEFYRACTQIS